jgi:hypothetical protein
MVDRLSLFCFSEFLLLFFIDTFQNFSHCKLQHDLSTWPHPPFFSFFFFLSLFCILYPFFFFFGISAYMLTDISIWHIFMKFDK